MPIGPGKYDDSCTQVRDQANARAAIIIVIDGELGNGCSCQADLEITLAMPTILRNLADEVERSLQKGTA